MPWCGRGPQRRGRRRGMPPKLANSSRGAVDNVTTPTPATALLPSRPARGRTRDRPHGDQVAHGGYCFSWHDRRILPASFIVTRAATTRDAGFHSLPLTPAGNARPAPTLAPPDAGADLLSVAYFCVTAPLATPPPADCTQTVVGRNGVTCLNCHVPPAALVVPMTAPGQLVPTAAPSWMVTLGANPPPGIWVLVPSMRSSPVPTL